MNRGNPSGHNSGSTRSQGSVTGSARESLKAGAANVAETAKDVSQQAAGQAKEKARSLFDDQKDRAVESISSVSSALRQTAMNLNEQNSPATSVIEQAASSLERFTNRIEGKDLDQIVRDVRSFARRNPAAFIGGAVAIGFLATRFFRSSAPDHDFDGGYYGGFGDADPYYRSGAFATSPVDSNFGSTGFDRGGYGTSSSGVSGYGSSPGGSTRGTGGTGGGTPDRGFGEDL